MKYESVKDRNVDLLETYGIAALGASEATYAGQPVLKSIKGFQAYLWTHEDQWHEWGKKNNRMLRLLTLIDALIEQGYYVIEKIEIQEDLVFIHRQGAITDLFFLLVDGDQQELRTRDPLRNIQNP